MRKSSFLIGAASVILSLPIGTVAQASQMHIPLPEPKYKVRLEKSIMIPMRDGIKLSMDLHFPVGAGDKFPVILIRTPYDKNTWRQDLTNRNYGSVLKMFVGQGYVVAVQDVRGQFESDGLFTLSKNERNDGYDTLTWLAAQPWCTGKIGTYGCSYLGESQMQLAAMRHPNHAAMVPQAAGGVYGVDGRFFGAKNAGAFELMLAPYFRNQALKIRPRIPVDLPRSLYLQSVDYYKIVFTGQEVGYLDLVQTLPVIDMLKKAGTPPSDFEDFVTHESSDPWWDQFGYLTENDRFDIPALHINSWYDPTPGDTLKMVAMVRNNSESELGRDNQFVIFGPPAHCLCEAEAAPGARVGQRYLGDTRFDYFGTYLSWFDHWLKGIDNGITGIPHYQMYIMGKDAWRCEEEWPPAGTKFTKYYLHSDGRANSRLGKGMLTTDIPKNEPPDRYIYDPKFPCPAIGGPVCATRDDPDAPPGAYDQSEPELRHDVLVYTTPALEEGLEVSGQIEAELYVSSSAKDTDFCATLVDVYPDGTAYNLLTGIIRARYREGLNKKVWMVPGGVYKVNIWLQATANYFAPGHRIRVDITSSHFPRWDRNLNTGGNNYDEVKGVAAQNTIHHSSKYPSHVVLPVIPEKQQELGEDFIKRADSPRGRLKFSP